MLLVDTPIWVDHLRRGSRRLGGLLLEAEVVCHPHVVGELACGHLRDREEVLSLLQALPQAPVISDAEFLFFVEEHQLMGSGLGFVDIHLLAAAQLAGVGLWTSDRGLRSAASRLGLPSV